MTLYRRAVGELSLLLFSINVPTIWMALAFIGLVAGLAVSQQRNEIAVLRSRGGTRLQVVGMVLAEGLMRGDCLTVTGKTIAENLAKASDLHEGHSCLDQPP